MACYKIVDIAVRDSVAYEDYKRGVAPLAAKHGGEYLVRGGEVEVIEGDWQPSRLVIFRFLDRESIRAFLDDSEYQPLKELRRRVADTSAVIVEGV